MRRCVILVAAVGLLTVPVRAAEIAPELWDRPRSAQAVMAQPAVRQAVAALLGKGGNARIVIAHGTRQETQLHAEELRAWLVALAVDSARLQLRADAAMNGIGIEVTE